MLSNSSSNDVFLDRASPCKTIAVRPIDVDARKTFLRLAIRDDDDNVDINRPRERERVNRRIFLICLVVVSRIFRLKKLKNVKNSSCDL